MSRCKSLWRGSLAAWVASMLLGSFASVQAQNNNNINQAVGGIAINASGVVGLANPAARKSLLADYRKGLAVADEEMAPLAPLRKVSLKNLEAACEEAVRTGKQLPEHVQFLGGLQRIQFVFVYPEKNDIVLAGPGEGWRVDDHANIVGITTGRPVLRLDDFLIALRTVQAARESGISCSIDPTEQGQRRLQSLLSKVKSLRGRNLSALEGAMKEAFGPQQVKLSGVPATSHFARVMVGADFKMKRYAMNLDRSPVRGLPSYLSMIRSGGRAANVNPRWWLACNYEPLARSEDGLAWELRGSGVKAMTEDEFVDESGKVRGSGKTSAAAKRWADRLTEHFDELSVKDPIFGELRNLMDMCVIAALLKKQDLFTRAGASLPLLTTPGSDLEPQEWNAPKTIEPQCSFLRTGNSYIVTASGGVQVESWDVVEHTQMAPQVAEVRARASAGAGKRWWWN